MSRLRDALVKYLEVRRAFGTQLREAAVSLGHFVDVLDRDGTEVITTQLAQRWAEEPQGVQRATWARRLTAVRQFAAWLSAFDPRMEIPPRGLITARHRRQKPHIFTEQEIEHLMVEAARLPSPRGLRALTQTTIIGLLAATGLRPGEALALQRSEGDLQNGILVIRQTKFGKSRFVPIEASTLTALAHYVERRDTLCPRRHSEAFFLSERGTSVKLHAVRRTFAKISRTIGIRAPAAVRRSGRGPRLQDFRHTFATRRLLEWYRDGVDVEREMPRLATYLGHVTVSHTYWYIEAIPELLQLATESSTARQQGGAR